MTTPAAHSPPHSSPPIELRPIVAANVRRLRVQRGLSLERLSRSSGVSRAMLSQIELEHSTPTVTVLAKIARALDLPISTFLAKETASFATVLRLADSRSLLSADGKVASRTLLPPDAARTLEFQEIRLAPRATETVESQPPGTRTTLVVHAGAISLSVGAKTISLEAGDAITFAANHTQVYENQKQDEARLFVVARSNWHD